MANLPGQCTGEEETMLDLNGSKMTVLERLARMEYIRQRKHLVLEQEFGEDDSYGKGKESHVYWRHCAYVTFLLADM